MTKGWTEERVARLEELAALGWSAGMIAQELGNGISRNAVIGKMARKNVKNMNRPFGKDHVARRPPRTTLCIYKVPVEEMEPMVAAIEAFLKEDGSHIGILDLSHSTCRWPIGHPGDKDFHYCGHKPRSGQTYCAFHRAIAYQKPSPHRKKLDATA